MPSLITYRTESRGDRFLKVCRKTGHYLKGNCQSLTEDRHSAWVGSRRQLNNMHDTYPWTKELRTEKREKY